MDALLKYNDAPIVKLDLHWCSPER